MIKQSFSILICFCLLMQYCCKDSIQKFNFSKIIAKKTSSIDYVFGISNGEAILRYKTPQVNRILEAICHEFDQYKIGWSCELYKKLDSLAINDSTIVDNFDILEILTNQILINSKIEKPTKLEVLKIIGEFTNNTYLSSCDNDCDQSIKTYYSNVVEMDFPNRRYNAILDVCEKEKLNYIKQELLLGGEIENDSLFYLFDLKDHLKFSFEEDMIPLYPTFLKVEINKDEFGPFIQIDRMYISYRSYFVNMPIRFDKGEGYEL